MGDNLLLVFSHCGTWKVRQNVLIREACNWEVERLKFLDLKGFAMGTANLLGRDVSAAFRAEVNHLNHQPQETAPCFPVARGCSIIALKAPIEPNDSSTRLGCGRDFEA